MKIELTEFKNGFRCNLNFGKSLPPDSKTSFKHTVFLLLLCISQCVVKKIGGVKFAFNKTAILLILKQVILFVSKMVFFMLGWIALSNKILCGKFYRRRENTGIIKTLKSHSYKL